MKRAALILAALAAIMTAAAAPVRTATENFVTKKIAEAVTNDVASAIASATNDPTIVRGEKLDAPPNVWNIIVFGALTAADADKARTAENASYVPWSGIEDAPTTLAGYGVAEDATNVVYGIVTQVVEASNPTFSNAVLSVGLNIDTNSVAVLNGIAETFGGFPIEGTATTVGGLLAALATAIAWLRKKKIDKLTVTGMSNEVTADGGVAKLDDFFTESNSLLNGRLAYSRNATGLKDRAFNTLSFDGTEFNLSDRAFNTLSFDGTEFNLSTALEAVTPTASGQPRDLLIVATATAATTIGYTAGTIKGDKPTIDGSGTWLITLTEYASGVWYCRQIKMEDAA